MATPITLTEAEILNASLLIVDDQQANVQLLTDLLAGVGYTQVTSTVNPKEVAKLHRRHQYDLILLDLQMPGMDGFEVMEQLQADRPSGYLPVLVVTAQPSQKLKALQAGAKDFVSKPFDVLEIQTRIRNMLEVRLLYKRIESDNRQLEQIVAQRTAELRESESRFRSLVELASDWYWEQDASGAFTKVSGPALEMLGLGGTDGAQASEVEQWNPEERAVLQEKLAMRLPFLDLVFSRTQSDGSQQFLQTSGEPKFDESGRFAGYRGIGMDVTGRMRSPARAARAEPDLDLERFRIAMDETRDGILLLDRASMRYLDVNRSACRMSGYSREELLAGGPPTLGDIAALPMHYDRLIAGDKQFAHSRADLQHKDGSRVPVEVSRHAAQTDGGWMLVEVLRALEA